jgi:molybdopterin-containing oxidoreductase family iron-sulfur binding subunit
MEQPVDPRYWTSLEELTGTAEVASGGGGRPIDLSSDARGFLASLPGVDRRSFLKLLGVSLAAGALSGCRKPAEKIIPYLNQPVEITPSVANWYATTCHGCSAACGVLAKVVDGRPIKFEGNPDHRISRGGLCAAGQGAVLSVYDAYRQKGPTIGGKAATWEDVDRTVRKALDALRAPRAQRRLVLLTGPLTGAASRALIRESLAAFPGAEHVVYDPVSYDAIREAHAGAYGRPILPGYRFDRADVIVSFGADFLGTWLSPVEFTKQYASGRDVSARDARMSRHFQFESRLSLSGSNADERISIAPSEQAAAVAALTARVARRATSGDPGPRALRPEVERALDRVAEALSGARGRSLVVSDSPDPAVQRAIVALNDALGNVGQSVDLSRPSQQKQGRPADMARLLAEMERGEVAVLLIHGCNPAYTYPEADAFATALRKVPLSVSFAVTPDETARLTTLHCPTHHPLESWGDAEPQVGRLSLVQPTLRPLYDTRAFEESLLAWSGRNLRFYDYLRRYWETEIFPRQKEQQEFIAFWDGMLQRGYLELPVGAAPGSWLLAPGSEATGAKGAELPPGGLPLSPPGARSQEPGAGSTATLEVEVYETVALRDGAGANNPWLHELPDPISKVTWDNYAAISPLLARERGIKEGQWIGVSIHGHSVEIPAHIQPGQHPRTISIALGYGRSAAGPVGDHVGVNAYPLVAGKTTGLECVIAARADRPLHRFGRTQIHTSMEGRPIVQEISYSDYQARSTQRASPDAHHEEHADLWHGEERPDVRWGMAIDLTRCVGCSACVVACDIENNVPVVGREEVGRQREMHWLRIDRYYTGDPEAPRVVHQPMMCQQCGNASCEVVCPVLATVHDDQGLNVQVYNRCVGTRYCSNNCPYKTRRFNFFDNAKSDPTQNLALNPDVTVRSRGIMEKCTFCVQRIQAAKSAARREGRSLEDGQVRTACEQSCPADAIVFGNLADPESRVSKVAAANRSYRVLEELNRQPAVVYLAKVRHRDVS